MKKIFSLLFSIAFLLVFISFFSQKTFAGTQCTSAGGSCINANLCSSANDLRSLGIYDCGTGSYCCTNSNGGSGSSLPATPTNLVANPYCNVNASLTTFSWSAASGATYYKISWGGQGTITLGNVTSYSINPTCTTGPGHCSLSYSANIPWYVQACNPSGCVTRTGPAYTSKDCTTISCTGSGGTCAANVCPSGTAVNPVNADLYNRSCVNPHPEQVPLCCFASAPSCGSKGGICSDAAHASLYGAVISGVTCNPAGLTCYSPAPVVTTCTANQTKINGACYNTCSGTCQATSADCAAYGGRNAPADPYCNITTTGGHPYCCATNTATCGGRGGICVEKSRSAAYGSQITGVAPCNPAGTTADPVLCYNPAPIIPVSTCNTDPKKPQVVLNNTCYNKCPGSCQADSSYCASYGGSSPIGDSYCNVSTNGGHSYCCATSAPTCTPDATCKANSGTCGAGTTKTCTNGAAGTSACSIPCPPSTPEPVWTKYCTGANDANGNFWQIWEYDNSTPKNYKFVENGTAANGCIAGQFGLALVVGLDGIGTTGDQVNADYTTKTNTAIINGQTVTNPVAGSNQSPKTPDRPVTLTLIDSANSSTTINGTIAFQTSGANKGKYTGTVPYGTTVRAGTYKVKVTVDTHLTKLVPGTITIANTTTTVNVPSVNLVAGDIDESNALNGTDYNILLSCMSDPVFTNTVGTSLCDTAGKNYKTKADLEDNGPIDKFDYNLFLREFSKVQTGD
jgi:hypothetical protein